jgi:hypothetical protein
MTRTLETSGNKTPLSTYYTVGEGQKRARCLTTRLAQHDERSFPALGFQDRLEFASRTVVGSFLWLLFVGSHALRCRVRVRPSPQVVERVQTPCAGPVSGTSSRRELVRDSFESSSRHYQIEKGSPVALCG